MAQATFYRLLVGVTFGCFITVTAWANGVVSKDVKNWVHPECLNEIREANVSKKTSETGIPDACKSISADVRLKLRNDGFLYAFRDLRLTEERTVSTFVAYKVVDRLRARETARDLVWMKIWGGGRARYDFLLVTPPVDMPRAFGLTTVFDVDGHEMTYFESARFSGSNAIEYTEYILAFGWLFTDGLVGEGIDNESRYFYLGPLSGFSPAVGYSWPKEQVIGFKTIETDLSGQPRRLLSVTLLRPTTFSDFASRCFNQQVLSQWDLPITLQPKGVLALERRFADVCFLSNTELEPWVRDLIDKKIAIGELPL